MLYTTFLVPGSKNEQQYEMEIKPNRFTYIFEYNSTRVELLKVVSLILNSVCDIRNTKEVRSHRTFAQTAATTTAREDYRRESVCD